jgi:hypothetical protein
LGIGFLYQPPYKFYQILQFKILYNKVQGLYNNMLFDNVISYFCLQLTKDKYLYELQVKGTKRHFGH